MNKKRVPAICPALALVMACSGVARADTFEWTNAVNGDFGDPARWTNTTGLSFAPPNTGDLAEFNEVGPYIITLSGNHNIDELHVFDGDVQFSSTTGVVRTLNVSTGNADANISGGNLYVGTASNPVFLNLPNVNTVGPNNISVMNIGSGSDGLVHVSGADSRLDVLGATGHNIGLSGATGTLNVEFGATANYGVNGTLNVGDSAVATSLGIVNVQTGGTLNTGHIDLATLTSAATGSMTVDGGGASISQTLPGATLDIGSASGGAGLLTIDNGGTFSSGTGQTTVLATGDINHSGGTYNANGDIVVNGGDIYVQSTSFNLATDKNLSASNGSQIDMEGDYFLRNGSTFTIDSDADLNVTGFFDIGNGSDGTLIVDGAGSSFNKSGTSFFGGSGATGIATIRNNATADLNGTTRIIGGTSTGVYGELNIESGAGVIADQLSIAHQGPDGTGSITVTGTGTTLTQNGTSVLTIGHATNGTATFTLADDATFTSGTGQTIISATGTVNQTGGTYFANGDMLINGGTFTQTAGFLNMGTDADLTIQNNGTMSLAPSGVLPAFNLLQTNTLTVDGEGSLLDFTGFRMRVQGGSTMNVINGGDVLIHTNFDVANSGDGTVLVSGAGSSLITEASNEQMWWGRGANVADITFTDGATGAFPGGVEIADSILSTATVTVSAGATVSFGSLDIANFFADDTTSATLTVTGAGSEITLDPAAHLNVGQHNAAAVPTRALVNIEIGGRLTTSDSGLAVYTTGAVNLDGGRLTLNGELNFAGPGPNFGQFSFTSGTIDFNTPTIDLIVDAFGTHIGSLVAPSSYFAGQHTINLAGDIQVHTGYELPMTGGELTADSLYLHTGAILSADPAFHLFTTVQAKTLAFTGSSIEVRTSFASIGDPSATNGFYSNGTINLDAGTTLTLYDANDAVLDSAAHVQLDGVLGSTPTLSAPNGLTLDFGANIEGYGEVNTPNDPTTPFINNGNLTGTSPAEPLTISGYIKGVGTMDHVVITGTDAPGFSIATVSRGSVTYAGTLEIELAASGSDTINHTDNATLGGVLGLALVSGFTPGLGDTFQFLTATSISGTFANITGANLGGGLMFDVIYGLNDVTLEVVNSLTGDLDGDGFVGINDLNIVLSNWNQNVPPGNPLADPSGDGFVGIDDLNQVLGNWNAGTPPPPIGQTSIPEPGVLMIVCVGGMGLAMRRKRR